MSHASPRRRAYSVVELTFIIAALSAISWITIPRLTHGASEGGGAGLRADLAELRNAIQLYRDDHAGRSPSIERFEHQMLLYSDKQGVAFSDSPDAEAGIIYGPYLRSMPALPVGSNRGRSTVADARYAAAGDGAAGWRYDPRTGHITANTPDNAFDRDLVRYNSY